MDNTKIDIIIVGTGPAGIEAAITAKLRNKHILLIGSKNMSGKISKSEKIENYLGIPNIQGKELNQRFYKHLEEMKIEIVDNKVNAIYTMEKYFRVQTDKNIYNATSVILATGVDFGRPYLGEEKYLGRGVSYCATCDGNLFRDKIVAIIGASSKEEKEANYLKTICSKVLYFPQYIETNELDKDIEIIREFPKEICGDQKVRKLITNKNEYNVDGLFILRDAISPKNLVPGLEMNENEVIVNRKMETNLPGLFACGDITGRPYQISKSIGEGNVAALNAVEYIDNIK